MAEMANEGTPKAAGSAKRKKPNNESPDKLSLLLNKPSDMCGHCNKACTSKGQAIQCDLCSQWVHAKCEKITTEDYTKFTELSSSMENIVYYCKYNSCVSRIGKIISDWMFQSDSSVQIVSEVDKGLQSLSEKHESLCKSVDELSAKIESLRSRDTDLQAKLQEKTFSLCTPSENTASLSVAANIVQEITERERRKKNLIILTFRRPHHLTVKQK